MNLNAPLTQESSVRAYLNRGEPIVRFRTDAGQVLLEQFHNIRGAYNEAAQTLTLSIAEGNIAITGPGAWEVCEQLCAGRATMIRTDGRQITSVQFTAVEAEI
jgi:hypothetical protein